MNQQVAPRAMMPLSEAQFIELVQSKLKDILPEQSKGLWQVIQALESLREIPLISIRFTETLLEPLQIFVLPHPDEEDLEVVIHFGRNEVARLLYRITQSKFVPLRDRLLAEAQRAKSFLRQPASVVVDSRQKRKKEQIKKLEEITTKLLKLKDDELVVLTLWAVARKNARKASFPLGTLTLKELLREVVLKTLTPEESDRKVESGISSALAQGLLRIREPSKGSRNARDEQLILNPSGMDLAQKIYLA